MELARLTPTAAATLTPPSLVSALGVSLVPEVFAAGFSGFFVGLGAFGADLFVYAAFVGTAAVGGFVFGAGGAGFGAGGAGGGGVGGEGDVASGVDVSCGGGKGAVVDYVQAKGYADGGAGAAG